MVLRVRGWPAIGSGARGPESSSTAGQGAHRLVGRKASPSCRAKHGNDLGCLRSTGAIHEGRQRRRVRSLGLGEGIWDRSPGETRRIGALSLEDVGRNL